MNSIFRTNIFDVNGQELQLGDIVKINNDEDSSTFEVIFKDRAFRKKYEEWDDEDEYPLLNDIHEYKIISTKEEMYYVQASGMYLGNAIAFCGENNCGYVYDLREAGKFTKDEASYLIKNSSINRPRDVAWKCSYIDNNFKAQKLIIDTQYLDHKLKITE